jgi:hypothetical protein
MIEMSPVDELSYPPGPSLTIRTNTPTARVPGRRVAPESFSGSITLDTVIDSFVPWAFTRWVAPTRGPTGLAALCLGFLDFFLWPADADWVDVPAVVDGPVLGPDDPQAATIMQTPTRLTTLVIRRRIDAAVGPGSGSGSVFGRRRTRRSLTPIDP